MNFVEETRRYSLDIRSMNFPNLIRPIRPIKGLLSRHSGLDSLPHLRWRSIWFYWQSRCSEMESEKRTLLKRPMTMMERKIGPNCDNVWWSLMRLKVADVSFVAALAICTTWTVQLRHAISILRAGNNHKSNCEKWTLLKKFRATTRSDRKLNRNIPWTNLGGISAWGDLENVRKSPNKIANQIQGESTRALKSNNQNDNEESPDQTGITTEMRTKETRQINPQEKSNHQLNAVLTSIQSKESQICLHLKVVQNSHAETIHELENE